MKVKLLVAALLIAGIAPAQASDLGAWVKVDANGNAIGGAIVCTPDVCGDQNSDYAKATLGAGEQYVLQAKADPITNNVAGTGNNSPGVLVKVDLLTQEWTITSTPVQVPPTAATLAEKPTIELSQTVIKFTAEAAPWSVVEETLIQESMAETQSLMTSQTVVKKKALKVKKTKAKPKKKASFK